MWHNPNAFAVGSERAAATKVREMKEPKVIVVRQAKTIFTPREVVHVKFRNLKWGLLLCLGTLLGAGAAQFYQMELQAWAQGQPCTKWKRPTTHFTF